ncbi:MAG: PSD1 domain-containing protein [Planctomycetes bacterium]|nr:PSD1 domain-containing protein [Planctomycetota bacterium]
MNKVTRSKGRVTAVNESYHEPLSATRPAEYDLVLRALPRKPFHQVEQDMRIQNCFQTVGHWRHCQITLLLNCFVAFFAGRAGADDALRFNRDVRPILSRNCFRCHGPDAGQREADLRLDRQDGIRHAFQPGKLKDSEAWLRINSDDPDERMPPPHSKLKLTPDQIAAVGRWIEQGATWQGHWAFIPPTRPPVPMIDGKKKLQPIDAFILARLQKEGLAPVSAADRATLLRRLSLDIIGLPPKPDQVEALVNDPSARAVENAVDRLLASPHFGERLAVYWLDLVRYADSVGYHKDSHRECWLYRDYVVQAFNNNTPFDRFIVEQLAGDLLKGSKFQQHRWKVASGLNRMNQTSSEGGAQPKEYLAKYSADRVRNTASIFLGATMGCSECHDHKYDPFTAKDFYNFAAFFADLQERGVGFPTQVPMPSQSQLDQWQKLELQLAKAKAANDAERIKSLEQQIKKLSDAKSWSKTLVTISGKPRVIRLLPRGNWLDESGPVAKPGIPEFLGTLDVGERPATRLDLANWIASRNNPLTARVFVNRLWKLFFGEGICRTLDDLGSQGEWPSHPELLDWLAVEFMASDWNVKHMVKLIVMSEAYQRSSVASVDLLRRDPENRLLARQSRFRLAAEFVRDNALAISGLLSPKMGGRSVKPYQPENYWYRLYKDGKYVTDRGEDQYRRGLYTYWRRSFWHASLRAFDAPAREECVAQRPRSNTPQQSLVLLNDPTYVEAARALAARMIHDGGKSVDARIAFAFRRAVARPPDKNEIAVLAQLYQQQAVRYQDDVEAAKKLIGVGDSVPPDDIAPAELAAWTAVARAILNLHETITRN